MIILTFRERSRVVFSGQLDLIIRMNLHQDIELPICCIVCVCVRTVTVGMD